MRNLKVIKPGSLAIANFFRCYRVFWNYAWTIADNVRFKELRTIPDWEFAGWITFRRCRRSSGAILLTAHMGSYDLGAHLFSETSTRRIVMVRAPEEDPQTREFEEHHGAEGLRIEFNTRATELALDLLETVREGAIVAIQGDRVTGSISTLPATFFGKAGERSGRTVCAGDGGARADLSRLRRAHRTAALPAGDLAADRDHAQPQPRRRFRARRRAVDDGARERRSRLLVSVVHVRAVLAGGRRRERRRRPSGSALAAVAASFRAGAADRVCEAAAARSNVANNAEHLILSIDRDQTAAEMYGVAIWVFVTTVCYFAAMLPLIWPSAIVVAIPLASIVLHLPIVVIGPIVRMHYRR